MSEWITANPNTSGTKIACDLFSHKCGTTACIAGWVTALAYPKGDQLLLIPDTIGEEVLGLTENQAARLFYVGEDSVWQYALDRCLLDDFLPEFSGAFPIESQDITPQIAAEVLRLIADRQIPC